MFLRTKNTLINLILQKEKNKYEILNKPNFLICFKLCVLNKSLEEISTVESSCIIIR